MAKIEENEEGIPVAEPIADDEGKSRRGMLKQIGLAAAALAASALTSSKASAQVEKKAPDKPPSEKEILAALRKNGITNLEQLAHKAATNNTAMSRPFIICTIRKYCVILPPD
jgi:hypothetical protein